MTNFETYFRNKDTSKTSVAPARHPRHAVVNADGIIRSVVLYIFRIRMPEGFDFVQIRLSPSRNIVFALANRLQNL
ncbi:hypothetical protein SDJN02_02268, partial [Cucurbita argyrosperma subsp. argyrosperma]